MHWKILGNSKFTASLFIVDKVVGYCFHTTLSLSGSYINYVIGVHSSRGLGGVEN